MTTGNKPDSVYTFHHTETGASHIRNNKPCQDYSFAGWNIGKFKRPGEQYTVAVVSDGHGSSDYFRSDRGARMACEAAVDSVRLFLQNNKHGLNHKKGIALLLKTPDTYMQGLKASIITRWRDAVGRDYQNEPFTEEEKRGMSDKGRARFDEDSAKYVRAYGATLIVVVQHPRFWFGLQMGDGKCVACRRGMPAEQPIPWDDRCFLNVTTSLCDDDALERFRHGFRTDAFPDAVYIASDGVDDSFGTDERLYDFYDKITASFFEHGTEKTTRELFAFLPELSAKGSGDDISIAGIVKMKQ